jgi:hypothetical protein
MPTAEQDALVAAQAADPNGFDWETYKQVYKRGLAEWQERLRTDARAAFRAMDGWARLKDEAEWLAMVAQADDALATGRFLIDRLGAERNLDPELMAALIVLRRRLITEYRVTGAADLLLIDSALIAWYHTLRINGWVGNFALLIEHEFFQMDGPTAKLRDRYGSRVESFKAEDMVQRIGEQLLPLLDRLNRLMLRNLRALRDPRQRPAANVTIGAAGQVNVGAQQLNVAETAGGEPEVCP